MIFITLGSQKFQFDRLLKKIDELIEKGIQSELFDKRATEYLKYRLDYKFWKNDSIREGIEWQDDLPF